MSLGPLGFGPLPSIQDQQSTPMSPWDLARLFNPRRLDGTGASLTPDGTADLPAGAAEHVNAGGDISAMFGGASMGAPQSFAGSATAPMVSSGGFRPHRYDAPADGNGPLPPPRPSAADLGPLSLGPIPGALTAHAPTMQPPPADDRGAPVAADFQPAPLPASEQRARMADMPAPGAVPISGQMPPLSFTGTPQPAAPVAPAPSPTAPMAPMAPAPAASPEDEGGGFLSNLSRPSVYNTLLGIGSALMTTRGVGNALAQGIGNASKLNAQQAATDLAQAEYGIKARKAGLEAAGQNATVEFLVKNGHARDTAQAMVLAAAGGNKEALSNALTNAVPKRPEMAGYTVGPDGRAQYVPGGPQDPATIEAQAKAREADKTLKVLSTPEDRAAAGISPNDTRTARIDPNGRVAFDPAPPAPVVKQFVIGGAKVDRVLNPTTGQWENPSFGANPPQAQAQLDNSDVPPGVDPATYRKEMAKATVQEQRGATQRAAQAASAVPLLERAERAYTRLGQNGGIGPFAASGLNRTITGSYGGQNEIDRQEYEAAAKELELMQAQIRMKGQGSVTDSERRLLALTLPRLDAASPETGLNTLRGMRTQFSNALGADKLPSYGIGRTAEPQTAAPARAAPVSQGMTQPPAGAIDMLRRDHTMQDAFDAKYGAGAAARVLGGQ